MINKQPSIGKQMKTIEKLAKLVVSHQLDSIEINGIKITKTKHAQPQTGKTQSKEGMMKIPEGMSEEQVQDLINTFWSA